MLIAVRQKGRRVESYIKDFRLINDDVFADPARTCSRPQGCIFYTPLFELGQYINDRSHHHDVWDVGYVTALDHMMDIAIKAAPTIVAPPVSILEVTPDKTEWVRKNDCPDIQTNKKTAGPAQPKH